MDPILDHPRATRPVTVTDLPCDRCGQTGMKVYHEGKEMICYLGCRKAPMTKAERKAHEKAKAKAGR